MQHAFCTLFDSAYLPRGLVMLRTLHEHDPEAVVYVLCMDDATTEFLTRAYGVNLVPVPLAQLEASDAGLASVRGDRTRAEYCWTATPALELHVLEREPRLEAVTYLDADLMFFSSPTPLFDEIGDASIAIVPHRYAPLWAWQEETHGIYNVEWVTFRRDEPGLEALGWWRERCLEWCFARVEPGRFGDQKYLDDWPERFRGVHVLRHPGAGAAPWNTPRHRIEGGTPPTVDSAPLVFFHFHSLALHRPTVAVRALAALDPPLGPHRGPTVPWSANYPVAEHEREAVWFPYLRRLAAAELEVGADPLRALLDPRQLARQALGPAVAAARDLRLALQRGGVDETWDAEAADAMHEVVAEELVHPEGVAPFRAFRYALEAVLADTDARPLRLLDVGCGIGHYGELSERWFHRDVVYTGCDASTAMVDAARRLHPDRRFEVDDLLDPRVDYGDFDVLLGGALIDVMAEWRQALDRLLRAPAPYVILHRQRVGGRTSVRRAPAYGGRTSHRVVLARRELDERVGSAGRVSIAEFPVAPGVETLVLRRAA